MVLSQPKLGPRCDIVIRSFEETPTKSLSISSIHKARKTMIGSKWKVNLKSKIQGQKKAYAGINVSYPIEYSNFKCPISQKI